MGQLLLLLLFGWGILFRVYTGQFLPRQLAPDAPVLHTNAVRSSKHGARVTRAQREAYV